MLIRVSRWFQLADKYAVEMINIHKIYPDGVVALRGVDLRVEKGEIHGLLGENGSGKTTLMRILYGEIKPTMGEIRLFGERVAYHGPRDAIRRGVGMVYQHFTLIPSFTVKENLYLSILSVKPDATMGEVLEKAEKVIKETGLKIPFDSVVEDLPVGVQQRVEIVKCLMRDAKILILDEPTSVLTPVETGELFQALKRLKERGVTIIFITHKLREVKEIADRVTVLRKGRVVGSVDVKEVNEKDLAKMMVERETPPAPSKRPASPGETLLSVVDLIVLDERGVLAVKGVSFELRAGEIFGIAGVQGNGQKELAEALAGTRKITSGKIILKGIDVTELPARERYRLGLAYVPDSRSVGLVYDMNIVENIVLTNLERVVNRRGEISWRKAETISQGVVKRFDVVAPSLKIPVRYLSGGNQQKVMVGREVVREPSVFIVSEPTQGLDVAATEFIRQTLLELRDKGKGVLLISTDLDEILQLSDRIGVIYDGRLVATGKPEEFSLEKLGLLMGGAL